MASITLNNKALERYYRMLKDLDDLSKKKLILKLTESLETKEDEIELRLLFGAWKDSRDSDEIINEIYAARVNKTDNPCFE